MSADNYMAVKQAPDGRWHVWMVLGGYEDKDWEIPKRTKGHFRGVFDTFLEAMIFAQKVETEETVEYGIHILSPVAKPT